MDAIKAIRLAISSSENICMGYLSDLTDEEMMHRPAPDCNHINWQVGHLIASDFEMIEQILPGALPRLPEGFEAMYGKQTAALNDAGSFLKKEELLSIHRVQRAAVLKLLDEQTPEGLDRETGVAYAPTVGEIFQMQGLHWLMHAGQWVVVRRQVGRAPLF